MSYCLPLAAIDTAVFPDSYAAARQRWLAQLNKLSCHSQCLPYVCPGIGPEGEQLVTDTAWIGPEDASRVLVLIGGTHGIEGFTGSAIQIDLLDLITDGACPYSGRYGGIDDPCIDTVGLCLATALRSGRR